MSLLDTLRGLFTRESDSTPVTAEQATGANAQYHGLVVRYHACQDPKEKQALFRQISRLLHSMLFLAAFCYEDENPRKKVHDRSLHATGGAKILYSPKSAVNVGNPGYTFATQDSKKQMHLRTLISKKTDEVWVPLYTDFEKYTAAFGDTSRVTLISFDEARKIAAPYNGVIINPGALAFGLSFNDMKRAR